MKINKSLAWFRLRLADLTTPSIDQRIKLIKLMASLKLETKDVTDILLHRMPEHLTENIEQIQLPMPKYDENGLFRH